MMHGQRNIKCRGVVCLYVRHPTFLSYRLGNYSKLNWNLFDISTCTATVELNLISILFGFVY